MTIREKLLTFVCCLLTVTLMVGVRGATDVTASDVSSGEASESNLFKELKVFTDVLSIVRRDYVSEPSNKLIVEGAIKGLLTTLDPHSGYLDPEFYQDLQVQTRGEFGGLGIEITIKDGQLIVVAPMEGSPAEKVGVKPGDTIVKIEGKFTKEFSLVDAVKRLRGPKGSSITISLARKGESELRDVSILRDTIAVKSVRNRYLGDGFGYIRVSQFVEQTTKDLVAALSILNKKASEGPLGLSGLKGLIVDMRNNPGGLLTQAVSVSDLFLKEGVIVYTDGRVEAQRQKFYATERGTEAEYPLIVLINGGSASAAEIFAGSLKDHGRALILGTQSFGKGSVQTITPLDNGGAVTLTTALYYTPKGRSLQALGVKPDVELEAVVAKENPGLDTSSPKRSGFQTTRESDLPGAIKNPSLPSGSGEMDGALEKINKTSEVDPELTKLAPETEDLSAWLLRDNQLQRALELLKTFNVFKK